MLKAYLVSAAIGWASIVQAQVVAEMTPERIQQAIAEGKAAGKDPVAYVLSDGKATCAFSTPFSRVYWSAHDAKKEYKDFGEADVTPELIAPEIRFYCPSVSLNSTGLLRANVKAIVLTSKGGGEVIKPSDSKEETQHFSNAFGAKAEGGSLIASFPIEAVKPGMELHVVYDARLSSGTSTRRRGLSVGGISTTRGCKSDDCALEIKLEKVR